MKFTPDVLIDVTTYCIITQIMEVLLLKVGFSVFAVRSIVMPSFMELMCYTGYKYVALVLNMLAGLLLGAMHTL